MGAWQQNQEITAETSLTYSAVFACVTLIASDIAKLGLRLVQVDEFGVWTETTSAAFSPVLRKPNRYQNRIKFIDQWMMSKLIHGNTYVLKERDSRGLVVALYVLDPTKVTPMVATSGDVFYELQREDLAGLEREEALVVPAREIIHDKMVPLYHPLVGVSPIHACGVAASAGARDPEQRDGVFSERLATLRHPDDAARPDRRAGRGPQRPLHGGLQRRQRRQGRAPQSRPDLRADVGQRRRRATDRAIAMVRDDRLLAAFTFSPT